MEKAGKFSLIAHLAKMGAHEEFVLATTSDLASALSVSQQTISRWLIELEREEKVERKGSALKLSKKASEELRALYLELKNALEPRALAFTGAVFSGLNDGKYYVGQQVYQKQFREKLGFAPYAGTLNLKIAEPEKKLLLAEREGVKITGFSSGSRVFGALKCFPAKINNKIKACILVPERSHYGNEVLEIISEKCLREELKLKDGDIVRASIE
ncbi:MAG: DUF120 domain-containing protein [Candidatus Micrarchaeota archaeon]